MEIETIFLLFLENYINSINSKATKLKIASILSNIKIKTKLSSIKRSNTKEEGNL